MANVILEGVFMGANLKKNTYEGNEKTTLLIDLYQPDSDSTDKMVTVRTNDVTFLNEINKDYDLGSVFKCKASINAYKNQAYFKFLALA
ncbi:hypothetical protein [Lysinibacillus capsici]|uniref:hypothetical protein n=1 Tax=Lysinibacillus capsici TaxID=2115968 RepID=UPI0028AFB16A|nr:hypothetical protein [Lysinibacillus capsici]